LQHPTYKAFAELGKAIKTIFLCQYLHSEALRREIHDGLNVVEQWNGATDFVFFARRGEMASNRREDHEISMLALHLMPDGRLISAVYRGGLSSMDVLLNRSAQPGDAYWIDDSRSLWILTTPIGSSRLSWIDP
jgi:hypothetical protein